MVKDGEDLSYYLEQEEQLAAEAKEPMFFTWVVGPTVIYGAHQVKEQEVNLPFCREKGIDIVQRKSGGGCVYADRGNVMLSFIYPERISSGFEMAIQRVVKALQAMGIEAVKTEHNDILVGECKVSGWACHELKNATIVHATMLYDVDFSQLTQAITPSRAKLEKHAVQSVRQRVRNIREIHDFGSTEEFRKQLEQQICLSA